MPDAPVVVLSPHLDDAVLSTFSVLSGPAAVHVVNVCTGLPGEGVLTPWDRLTGASDSRTRMLERLAEDRVALAQVGREATGLDLLDAQYREGPLDRDALRDALEPAVKGAAQVWAPAGIGGHDDHLQIRDAALELCAGGGADLSFYADLPYAAQFGWPGWMCSGDHDPDLLVHEWWCSFLPAELDLKIEKHALSATAAREKLRALAAYRTQIPGLNGGPTKLLERPSIVRYEVSWLARAGSSSVR